MEVLDWNFYGRDIKVIHAECFADAILETLQGTPFEKMPRISTFSQEGNLTALSERWDLAQKAREIYQS